MKKDKFIVYDDYSAMPLQVSFMGDNWWVTTPGEKLQLLEDYFEGAHDINFCFLCEAGERVGALALARMLGKALEEPEDTLEMVLNQRVKALRRLGVEFNVDDEVLQLELRVFANEEKSKRQGRYSVWCHIADNFCDMLFDIDCFDKREDAEAWVNVYFDTLTSLGIRYTLVNKGEISNEKD